MDRIITEESPDALSDFLTDLTESKGEAYVQALVCGPYAEMRPLERVCQQNSVMKIASIMSFGGFRHFNADGIIDSLLDVGNWTDIQLLAVSGEDKLLKAAVSRYVKENDSEALKAKSPDGTLEPASLIWCCPRGREARKNMARKIRHGIRTIESGHYQNPNSIGPDEITMYMRVCHGHFKRWLIDQKRELSKMKKETVADPIFQTREPEKIPEKSGVCDAYSGAGELMERSGETGDLGSDLVFDRQDQAEGKRDRDEDSLDLMSESPVTPETDAKIKRILDRLYTASLVGELVNEELSLSICILALESQPGDRTANRAMYQLICAVVDNNRENMIKSTQQLSFLLGDKKNKIFAVLLHFLWTEKNCTPEIYEFLSDIIKRQVDAAKFAEINTKLARLLSTDESSGREERDNPELPTDEPGCREEHDNPDVKEAGLSQESVEKSDWKLIFDSFCEDVLSPASFDYRAALKRLYPAQNSRSYDTLGQFSSDEQRKLRQRARLLGLFCGDGIKTDPWQQKIDEYYNLRRISCEKHREFTRKKIQVQRDVLKTQRTGGFFSRKSFVLSPEAMDGALDKFSEELAKDLHKAHFNDGCLTLPTLEEMAKKQLLKKPEELSETSKQRCEQVLETKWKSLEIPKDVPKDVPYRDLPSLKNASESDFCNGEEIEQMYRIRSAFFNFEEACLQHVFQKIALDSPGASKSMEDLLVRNLFSERPRF